MRRIRWPEQREEWVAVRMISVLVLFVSFVGGCRAPGPEATEEVGEPEAASAVERYEGRGVFLYWEDESAFISHDDIPGFMPAMTMGFPVSDPSILEGVERDSAIKFQVVVEGDDIYVDAIEVVDSEEGDEDSSP